MYDVLLLIFVVENMAVINVIIIIRLCVSQSEKIVKFS